MKANEDSPIHCASRSHDKENKTIIIDFGDGCIEKHGREKSDEHLKFKIELVGGKVTFEDGVGYTVNITKPIWLEKRMLIYIESNDFYRRSKS